MYKIPETRPFEDEVYAMFPRGANAAHVKKHRDKNPVYVALERFISQSKQRRCLPDNVTRDDLRPFAEEQVRLTAATGISFSIDHITPVALGGQSVPDNLIVIPNWLNMIKHTKVVPDIPAYKELVSRVIMSHLQTVSNHSTNTI